MSNDERRFLRWLAKRLGSHRATVRDGATVRNRATDSDRAQVTLGVGDDMAVLRVDEATILLTADMLLDGVHFKSDEHSVEAIGTKAIGCSLSDCAAMAVQPVAATVSLALPRGFQIERAKALIEAMDSACKRFDCSLVGGDTTSWDHPMAIDVAMLATCHPGTRHPGTVQGTTIAPVRRDGGQPGDGVFVTGTLGGSLLGRHLTFTPRVHEARVIAEKLGDRLHAMLDISDGLAIDLDRIAEASGVAAVLDEPLVTLAASPDARKAADLDGRTILDHVLYDGEDFELLIAAQIDEDEATLLSLRRLGVLIEGQGLRMRTADGVETPLEPGGYQHF